MRVLTAHLVYPQRTDIIRIKPFFDMHLGSKLCDEDLIDKDIAEVLADPNAYAGLGGDMCDFINRGDKRFQQSQLAPWLQGPVDDIVEAQIERVKEKFKPLADAGKVLFTMAGNHETSILAKYERDVYYEVTKALKRGERQIGLGFDGFVVLYLQRGINRKAPPTKKGKAVAGFTADGQGVNESWRVVLYLHHGYGGGGLEGAGPLALGRVLKHYDADVALLGHRHSKDWISSLELGVSPKGVIRERERVAAFCAGYKRPHRQETGPPKGGTPYEVVKGYAPKAAGCPWLRLIPAEHAVKIEH